MAGLSLVYQPLHFMSLIVLWDHCAGDVDEDSFEDVDCVPDTQATDFDLQFDPIVNHNYQVPYKIPSPMWGWLCPQCSGRTCPISR